MEKTDRIFQPVNPPGSKPNNPPPISKANLLDKEKVAGLFLISDLEMVKREKGQRGLDEIQKMVTDLDLKKISPIKKYPLAQEISLLRAIGTVLYGNDSKVAWKKLGAHELETARTSTLGKVIFSLIGTDFVSLLKNANRLFNVFVPFVVFNCEVVDDKRVVVTIENDPYPKEYYLGSFEAFLDFIKIPGRVRVEELIANTHVYTIDVV